MKYTLNEICDFTKGPIGITKAIPGEFPMVTLAEKRKTNNEYHFDTKAVIVPLVSSTGHGHASMKRVHYQEGRFTVGSILCVVEPKDTEFLIPKFLHIYLSYFKEQLLVPLMKGAANVSLSIKSIKTVEIEVPSPEKQRELIELSKKLNIELDKVGIKIQDQLTDLKSLRQAILQEAIQGKLIPQNPDDEPAEKQLQHIRNEKERLIAEKKIRKEKWQEPAEEETFNIPNNWSWEHLGNTTIQITDGTHQTPSYTSTGRVFLSAQNVKPFRFMPEYHKFVSQSDFENYNKTRKAELGDLLVARVGAGIGETAVIDQDIEFAFYVSLGLVKPFKKLTNNKYLELVFNSPYGVRYSKGNISSKGGSAGNFNLGRIRAFKIPFPPLAEQKRIVKKVESLLGLVSELESQVKEQQTDVERLMQGVLQEAFSN